MATRPIRLCPVRPRLRRLSHPRGGAGADLRPANRDGIGAGGPRRRLLPCHTTLTSAQLWVRCSSMKRSESLETKSLVDSLLADGPAPTSVAREEFERARALARSIPSANPPDVEALPEPLPVAVLDASVRARAPRLAAALASSARKPV